MRHVKCYECGKKYDYDEDGFCPRCGAFTQPTRASRIGLDGSVIRTEGINERNHSKSFVHNEYHSENKSRKGSALEAKRGKHHVTPQKVYRNVGGRLSKQGQASFRTTDILSDVFSIVNDMFDT